MKRLILSVLALMLLLLPALSMAGEYTISEEPVSLKVIIVESDIAGSRPGMWVFEKIAQTTGVKMEVEKISDSIWQERKNLIFAANDLPDLIFGGFSNAEWTSFSKTGQLLPVDEMLQYMPNYQKILDRYTTAEKFGLYDAEGRMTGFIKNVNDGMMAIPGARAIINERWLEVAGKEMPTNFEEFVDVLRAFKELDVNENGDPNDEIPLSGYSDYRVDAFVAMPLGIAVDWSKKSDWVEVDGDIEFLYTNERYRAYLERMNLLYTEGLLDNEYYTQNRAQMLAKGANMQVGVCTFNAPFVLTGDTDLVRYGQYTAMIPMGSEYSEPKQFFNKIGVPAIYVTGAARENGKMEIAAKLLDFLWTEEYATYNYGPEKGSEILGDWDGEGGVVWNADHTKWDVEVPEKYNGVFEYVTTAVNSMTGYYFDLSDFLGQWDMVEEDVVLIEIFKDVWPYVVPNFPPRLTFTEDETEEVVLIQEEINTYVTQMEAKFVMGEEPLTDESWEAFQNHLQNMDVDVLVKVYKDAYARYLDALAKVPS